MIHLTDTSVLATIVLYVIYVFLFWFAKSEEDKRMYNIIKEIYFVAFLIQMTILNK